MRIDPGLCPICGNPICTNVPFTCPEICEHSLQSTLKTTCYQLGDYVSCECSFDDIMELFGGTFKEHLSIDAKGYKLAELMIELLQGNGLKLNVLPDDLFEI